MHQAAQANSSAHAALTATKSRKIIRLAGRKRRAISRRIERLIEVLDAADPDPDLELTGDDEPQPDEECPPGMLTSTSHARIGLSDDDEEDDAAEVDDEPEYDYRLMRDVDFRNGADQTEAETFQCGGLS